MTVYLAIFVISLCSLTTEILLTKVFDVILSPNLAFMIITGSVFGLGCGGLYDVLRPLAPGQNVRRSVAASSALFALALWTLPMVLNAIPFNFDLVEEEPVQQLLWFLALYPAVIAPFFFVGLSICRLFSAHTRDIQRLYFWDLAGAALGALCLIPVLPVLGAERVLMVCGMAAMLASVLFAERSGERLAGLGAALLMGVLPSLIGSPYLTLRLHDDKRGVRASIERGEQEFSRWDPISRIDVLDQYEVEARKEGRGFRKHVAYDGGSQSSYLYAFDGDFARLRDDLPAHVGYDFWTRGVLASHYLKRDTGHSVLIVGSAGGQETKAALLFGAKHVDAIELVGTVVELVTGAYSDYIGGIFRNPAVHVHVEEGRSFLRASGRKYDVIQMFSNHNTSSIAAGNGAIEPVYQQTVEAYEEYFEHLAADGILHVNRHYFPRMVATASVAWRRLGRSSFRDHVVIVQRTQENEPSGDSLPTFLIKMTPWTRAEIDELTAFYAFEEEGTPKRYEFIENPFDREHSFLPDEFFSGDMPSALRKAAPFDLSVSTDDRPYINFARRKAQVLEPDQRVGLDWSTVAMMNTQMREGWIPMDWLHLIAVAAASSFYGLLFVLVPMLASGVGRERWDGKLPALSYFSLLGLGFIVVELTFIQIFMKIIGYPLYAIATVISAMLISAALGSICSSRLAGLRSYAWNLPFAGGIASGLLLWLVYPALSHLLLALDMTTRILATCVLIFPTAFFLGMPFPLGLLELRSKPRGAVAWAWSMNGLFTTIGGIVSVLLALEVGFQLTLLIALGLYLLAWLSFAALRRSNARVPAIASVPESGSAQLRPRIVGA